MDKLLLSLLSVKHACIGVSIYNKEVAQLPDATVFLLVMS